MRIVIALGGNALLKRGEPMTAENQRSNVRSGAHEFEKIQVHPVRACMNRRFGLFERPA